MLLVMVGILNLIYGIAALAKSQFYPANVHYAFGSLELWGWVLVIIGASQCCVAIGIWVGAGWARWSGVGLAALNAVVQLLFIAAYPLLSLAIVALDVLVIYGLVAYGEYLESS
jgi:hypothetical protein